MGQLLKFNTENGNLKLRLCRVLNYRLRPYEIPPPIERILNDICFATELARSLNDFLCHLIGMCIYFSIGAYWYYYCKYSIDYKTFTSLISAKYIVGAEVRPVLKYSNAGLSESVKYRGSPVSTIFWLMRFPTIRGIALIGD